MISHLYHSLCLILFIIGLVDDVVALGASIRALYGEIAENWPSKVETLRLNSTSHVRRVFQQLSSG